MNWGTSIYANMIRVVKVIRDPPDDSFHVGGVYKCLPCTVNVQEKEQGGSFTVTPYAADKAIYCASLNNALLIEDQYYIAYQVHKGVYVIFNQAVFLEL